VGKNKNFFIKILFLILISSLQHDAKRIDIEISKFQTRKITEILSTTILIRPGLVVTLCVGTAAAAAAAAVLTLITLLAEAAGNSP